jgi:hypothetical protein
LPDKIRRHITFANVCSLTALFIALGGSAYAGFVLPRNSVGSSHIVRHGVGNSDLTTGAVTSRVVRNGTLTNADFLGGGVQFPRFLPRGTTLVGNYSAGGEAPYANAYATDAISFGFILARRPALHFVKRGEPVPTACPGNATAPTASPGHLCVYEAIVANAGNRTLADSTQNLTGSANWYGAHVNLFSAAAGPFDSAGTWAITAPNR